MAGSSAGFARLAQAGGLRDRDLTGVLAKDKRLRSFARTLEDRRVKKVRDFFEGPHGKYARHLADQRTPQVAKDWHFRMNMDMENFRQLYSKFREAS